MEIPEEYQLERPSQLKALASPLRSRIFDLVVQRESLTVKDLSGLLGKKPSAMYYHLDLLEKEGLLICEEGDVARYFPVAKVLRSKPGTHNDPAWCAALNTSTQGYLRSFSKRFDKALLDPKALAQRNPGDLQVYWRHLRLDREGRRELARSMNRFWDEVYAIAESSSEDASLFAVGLFSVPDYLEGE